MNTLSRSWQLVKESFSVLRKDKELLLFPLISGAVSIVLFAIFLVSVFFTGLIDNTGSILSYVILFAYYLASYFVIIFFNTGLITCANIRLNGGDPKFRDGINNSFKNLGKIFTWALISATLGIILKQLSQRSGLVGRIIIGLVGMAWGLLTFFVIPVMIFENVSVTESIKRSGSLFKKTWGENVVGQFSIGLIFFLLALIGVVPLLLGVLSIVSSVLVGIILIGIAILYWVFLAILSMSLDGIFVAALYNYANKGVVPAGFSEESIKGAYKSKTSILQKL